MTIFQYTPAIIETFPHIVGGVLLSQGIHNTPTPEILQQDYANEQEQVKSRIGDTPLSQIDSLAAWRRAFSTFGVNPTKYRSAAEALLRRLTKAGDIPSINLCVDLGNLVSIRYGLPVAVIDLRAVQGAITVQFADGDEPFIPLGQAEPEFPAAGEVIFADAMDQVIARRWCWRQSADSAANLATTRALITVEAHHHHAHADVAAALADLELLFSQYAGGSYQTTILDAQTRAFAP